MVNLKIFNIMKTIHWKDIDCIARIKIDEHSMDFEVFEIIGTLVKDGSHEFEKKGAKSSEDTTVNLDEAQTLLRGHIKWDACSHVNFGDEYGYIHLCGGNSWFTFMEATKRIWDIAMKELPEEHSKDMFDMELFEKSEKK